MFLPTILERIRENLSIGPQLGYVVDATNKVIFEKAIRVSQYLKRAYKANTRRPLVLYLFFLLSKGGLLAL